MQMPSHIYIRSRTFIDREVGDSGFEVRYDVHVNTYQATEAHMQFEMKKECCWARL